jgi:hypothetical protein
MTDVFVKFAETGKLSFKNLLTSMADDIITFEVKISSSRRCCSPFRRAAVSSAQSPA